MTLPNRRACWAVVMGMVFAVMGDPAFGVDGQPVWTPSLVYQAGADPHVSSPVLAFDHYGTPSVSWSLVQNIVGDNTVFHSQLSGLGVWMHHELASGPGVGLRTSLAFDRAERPTVVWLDDNGALNAKFNFGASEQIAGNADWGSPILSVSYDLAGDLRGMYRTTTSEEFDDISRSEGTFQSGDMVTFDDAGTIADAAMVTDHQGARHIVAREELGGGQWALLLASEMVGAPPQDAWAWARPLQTEAISGVDVAVDPTDGRLPTQPRTAAPTRSSMPSSTASHSKPPRSCHRRKICSGTYRSRSTTPTDGRGSLTNSMRFPVPMNCTSRIWTPL